MPIDPNIALQVQMPDIAGAFGSALQNRAKNALVVRELQAADAAQARKNAMAQVYSEAFDPQTGEINTNKLFTGLVRAGAGAELPDVMEKFAKTSKEQFGAKKAQQEFYTTTLARYRDLLPAVNDQASYDQWRTAITSEIPSVAASIPPQFSPQVRESLMKTADQELQKHFVTQDLGGSTRVIAMPKFGSGAAAVVPGTEAMVTRSPNAPVTNINMPAQEKAFNVELGKLQAKDLVGSKAAATDAAAILATNNEGRRLLDSGIITGFGADFLTNAGAALQQAGIKFNDDKIANTQAYAANMAANTGKLIKQFGAGTGLSDADREFASKMAGGQVSLNEKSLRRILDINDRAARNVINLHNRSAKGVESVLPLEVQAPAPYKPVAKAPPPPASNANLPTITTETQYNKLRPGSYFKGPDGKTRRKPLE